jgi:CHAT domain-containing protein
MRVLVAVANPEVERLPGADQEVMHLKQTFERTEARGRILLRILEKASVRDLQSVLRSFKPHILHFIGHGGWREGRAFITLISSDGRPELIDADQLGVMLRDEGILLAVLNGCETSSALGGKDGNLTQALVAGGAPAAIGTSRAVFDEVAVRFADEFYRALVDGYSVEAALVEGRKALSMKRWDWPAYILYSSHILPLEDIVLRGPRDDRHPSDS